MTKEQTKAYIEALLREKEGYVRYGRDADAAEVDKELKRVGYKAQTPQKRAVKMTRTTD